MINAAPLDEVKKPSHGLSIFYTDFDKTKVETREIHKVRLLFADLATALRRCVRQMARKAVDTNMLFFDGWSIPAEDLIGEEGDGFKM